MSPTPDFYLLGAGFSKAISRAMPVLVELQEQVLNELGLGTKALTPFSGSLEEWLSYIAVNQPWLSDAENLRNRARFLEASEAVYKFISRAEDQAVATAPPSWLMRLVFHWADRSSVLATFNYDLLVERMVTELRIASSMSDVYGVALARRDPPSAGLSIGAAEPRGTVPTMYKLHGSRNWYYGGPDAPVTEPITIADGRVLWRSPQPTPPRARRRQRHLLDGLAPMVIPPTGTKSAYYMNRALRAQWKRAAHDLSKADRVIVIGYSFPPSDLQARHFLASNARPGQEIVVVDLSETPAATVRTLLPDHEVRAYTGVDAVAQFTDDHAGDLVTWRTLEGPPGTFRPEIMVGNADVTANNNASPPTSEYEGDVVAWLQQEVERRWDGLSGSATADPRAVGADLAPTPPMVAYLSKFAATAR